MNALSLSLALAAAACLALASVVQHDAARSVVHHGGAIRLFARLLRDPKWLLGRVIDTGALVLQGFALAHGSLIAVQATLTTSVVLALGFEAPAGRAVTVIARHSCFGSRPCSRSLRSHPATRDTCAMTSFEHLTQLGTPTETPDSPESAVLEAVPAPEGPFVVRFTCPEFTTLCPVTGQPDFAHLVIDYVPDRLLVESKSLKLFLNAFRNKRDFHEA